MTEPGRLSGVMRTGVHPCWTTKALLLLMPVLLEEVTLDAWELEYILACHAG